jgi:hypothetical protein
VNPRGGKSSGGGTGTGKKEHNDATEAEVEAERRRRRHNVETSSDELFHARGTGLALGQGNLTTQSRGGAGMTWGRGQREGWKEAADMKTMRHKNQHRANSGKQNHVVAA